MYLMEASDKNAETVNEIIKILTQKEYTLSEAYSILESAMERIEYTSKVGYVPLTFSYSQ